MGRLAVVDDTGSWRIDAFIDLASELAQDLGILTDAMTTLGEGIMLVSDKEKDRRTCAYLALRTYAVDRFPAAPAHQTDPWAWDDFLEAFKEREGRTYTGSGNGITAAMLLDYLTLD